MDSLYVLLWPCWPEKIAGDLVSPRIMFIFKTEETQEASLNHFSPFIPFCLIRHWKLTQFWRNSLVLAVNYVDFF